MARRPRLQFAGGFYHVMARGNRKSTIFHDDDDRRQLLHIVDEAVAAYNLRIYSYCLMRNHYHFVLETPEPNLSAAMQFVNGVFARRSNRRHKQTGHVFEGRFRSLVIQRESYLVRAARYVVRNPVRAGLVEDAGAWPWSSYLATVGRESVPCWLNVDWIRWAFKARALAEAQRRYADYVNEPADSQRPLVLNAVVLGTKHFARRVLQVCEGGRPDRPAPRVIRRLFRPTLSQLFDGVPASPASRDRLICTAHVEHGYGFSEIASYLGLDRSTASKAARRGQRLRTRFTA
jgi:REP element-mobilizing transposase RayT